MVIYVKISEFIERDGAMLKADIEVAAAEKEEEMMIDKRPRCFTTIGKELVLFVAVLMICWLLLGDNFVDDTCYWKPPSASQLHVRLHWKPDRNLSPVVRTQVSNNRASKGERSFVKLQSDHNGNKKNSSDRKMILHIFNLISEYFRA